MTETSVQQLTVEQYDGRDYGEVVIVFTLPEEVENTFQVGEYVEIYYGALKESAPDQADAISVNKLADQAESVVTNGTIKEVTTSEDGTGTDLLLTDSKGQEVVFHISESTQIYICLLYTSIPRQFPRTRSMWIFPTSMSSICRNSWVRSRQPSTRCRQTACGSPM